MSGYLRFQLVEDSGTRRTQSYAVRSRRSGEFLGRIAWYSPWRRYVFSPMEMTDYDAECLEDIALFLGCLMAGRPAAVPPEEVT